MGKIKELILEFDDEALLVEVEKELAGGTEPSQVLAQCQEAMMEIGDQFDAGEMFVSDLMMAGSMFKDVSALTLPLLKQGEQSDQGTVVLGTVKDDIHDIGKDIVANMLKASGFNVIDLGINVAPERFVAAIKEHDAKVLALSCLLASAYGSILATVEAVKAAGLRDEVKIIIGGGPVDEHVVAYSGADAFGGDAQAAVNYCKEVLA